MIRAANNRTRGVRTFYVRSQSRTGVEHVVQYIRRGRRRAWFCSCEDFQYRRLPLGRHCKHCRALAALAREYHGVSRLARRAA